MSTFLARKSVMAAREATILAGSVAKCATARHSSTLAGRRLAIAKGETKDIIRRVNENPAVGPAAAAATNNHRYEFFSTTASGNDASSPPSYRPYTPPDTVLEWEKLATKELARSKTGETVESLRTSRTTPEGIGVQPVYFDLDSDEPEMPGVYPYTRGPYATMYTVRPWTVRQ